MAKENDAGSWLIRIQTQWKNEGMDKFLSSMRGLRSTLGGAKETFLSTSGEAAELYRDAKYIGTSVTQIEKYAVALKLMGGNATEAKDQILGLSEAYNRIKMGDLSAEDYARLGLTNEDMQDYDKFFQALRRRFKDSQDYGFFRELAGRVGIGRDMMNLISSSEKEYQDVMGFSKSHILVNDKEAKKFQEFEKNIAKFKVSWSQLKKELMVKISPSLTDFFQRLQKMFEDPKVIEGVKNLGDEMANFIEKMTTEENTKEFFQTLNDLLSQILEMAKHSKPIFQVLEALGKFIIGTAQVAGAGTGALVGAAFESEGGGYTDKRLAKLDVAGQLFNNRDLDKAAASLNPLSSQNIKGMAGKLGMQPILPTRIKVYLAGDISGLVSQVRVQIEDQTKANRVNIIRKNAKEQLI